MKYKEKFRKSLFIDSSNLEEIKKWNYLGLIDGVTTNQYILLKEQVKINNYYRLLKNICREMKGKPVSVELSNSQATLKKLLYETRKLASISANIVIKVPLIPYSDKSFTVIRYLIENKIHFNVTVLMTYEQLILAILACRNQKQISFVSLFWGRTIDDHNKYRSRSDFMAKYPHVGSESTVNSTPHNIIQAARIFIDQGNYNHVRLITGSIRTAGMVGEAFYSGSDIVTVTPQVLEAMTFSQRTIETNQQFDEAYKQLKGKKLNK